MNVSFRRLALCALAASNLAVPCLTSAQTFGATSAQLRALEVAGAQGGSALEPTGNTRLGIQGPVGGLPQIYSGAPAWPAVGMPGDVEAPLPPPPPRVPAELRQDNEFQKFVRESTGRQLTVFGQSFFDRSAGSFTPVARLPVPADYIIGPGDELRVRVWGAVDVNFRAVVDRNGIISIPRVGAIPVAGIKASEIEGHLEQQIGRVFRNFSLNVTLGQLRSIQIFVVGQAHEPGGHTIGSLSTLVNAVFASGGPSHGGSLRRIQLRRDGRVVAELDLYEFLVRGDKSGDQRLLPGDVIVYPPAGQRVALMGAVDNPAVYELHPAGETLQQLLSYAGGASTVTARHRALIERIDFGRPQAPREVQAVALDAAGLGRTLRDGDIVTLFPIEPGFANAVTLRGNVARALRHPFSQGMRVSDLIPDREALLTPDYHRRKNRLVQYMDEPSAVEQPDKSPAEAPTGQGGTQPPAKSPAMKNPTPAIAGSTRDLIDEPNWEFALIERINLSDLTPQFIPFHLGRAISAKGSEDDLVLQPGDIVTVFNRRDLRSPQATTTRVVRVEGEVTRPGLYQLQPGETLRALLERAGGMTPQAYVFGTEFSREETRRKQREALRDAIDRLEASLASASAQQVANLSATDAATALRLQTSAQEARKAQLARLRNLQPNGRISLELSPGARSVADLPDVPLEDGDRVVVPSRPGFIFAVGAVANNNAIVWRAGRTLGDYLRAAGVEASADENNLFVVRADGSVVHARDHGSFFSRIRSLQLAPGDTIVVPEMIDRETHWSAFVRGLKDWSQILYQFGIAAAALEVLRR